MPGRIEGTALTGTAQSQARQPLPINRQNHDDSQPTGDVDRGGGGLATLSAGHGDYGLASILLYLIPAVVFLVPTALVAAELATGWKGGVYVWVREAFGNRIGFLAIWLQWIQNVVWYPIQIAFIAVSLSYVFGDGWLGQ